MRRKEGQCDVDGTEDQKPEESGDTPSCSSCVEDESAYEGAEVVKSAALKTAGIASSMCRVARVLAKVRPGEAFPLV